MSGHKLIQIVAAESTPEKDAKFEKWYRETHVPTLFAYPGLKQASRYRLKGENPQCSKYLTIYEFDTEEELAGFAKSQAFANAITDFETNKDEVGFISKWFGVYELIKTWEK